jgi:predicted nucleotidyltransferase
MRRGARKAAVMVSMAEIREVARRIGREFRPRRVILFGSYACGKPTVDSDVDLLVIMPLQTDPVYKSVEIALKVRPGFPMDLLVRTPAEVRKRLAWNDFFIREIMEKGKVLYASDALPSGWRRRKKTSAFWIPARRERKKPAYSAIGFHAQQCAEKYLIEGQWPDCE